MLCSDYDRGAPRRYRNIRGHHGEDTTQAEESEPRPTTRQCQSTQGQAEEIQAVGRRRQRMTLPAPTEKAFRTNAAQQIRPRSSVNCIRAVYECCNPRGWAMPSRPRSTADGSTTSLSAVSP